MHMEDVTKRIRPKYLNNVREVSTDFFKLENQPINEEFCYKNGLSNAMKGS
jgi:hypothetical protein